MSMSRVTAAAAGWSDCPLIACARTVRQSGVVRVLQTARIMEATELLPSAFKNNEVAECRNQRHAQDPVSSLDSLYPRLDGRRLLIV